MLPKKQSEAGALAGGEADLRQFAPEETIGFLIWDTIRTFHRTFQKLVSTHGINFGLWPFLRALWVSDGIGIRDLSQRVHMAPPTTLKAVVTLERRGFVYRTGDANDARKTLIYLTPKGRKLFASVVPDMDYVNRMAVAGMSKHEQDEVKRLLKHMRANMQMQEVPAKPAVKSRRHSSGR